MSDDVTEPTTTPAEPPPAGPIVARGGGEYRLKRGVLLVLLLLGFGVAFLYDGFVRYPRENAEYHQKYPGGDTEPHPGYTIPWQKRLGVALVPLSLLIAARVLYASRGEVRLDEADVLHVPGHPPVPLSAVTSVDRQRWDRKGIAVVTYALADGTAGTFKLDDFVYQMKPIDAIYDRVVAAVETPAASGAEPPPAGDAAV